jgi:hypothetical protein
VAIGRKNYLFAGNHEAAQRNAMIYTFVNACKLHGVNPEVWLEDVLGRLHNHSMQRLEELLPHHWQPLQPGLKADPPRRPENPAERGFGECSLTGAGKTRWCWSGGYERLV